MPRIRQQTVYLRGKTLSEWQFSANQDREGIRLTRQHRLLQAATSNKNRFAPVKNPQAILDVACGTGIWGLDEALHFKQAIVTNLDINDRTAEEWIAIYTTAKPRVRERLPVVRADALKPLPFQKNTFDFVHGRLLATFVPVSAWPDIIGEMRRVTKPGGWIELVEGEYPELAHAPNFTLMREALMRFLSSQGLHQSAASHLTEYLRAADTEALGSRVLRVGERHSQRLKLADNFVAAAQAFRSALVEGGFLEPAIFDDILPKFREEMLAQLVWKVTAAWGRKPQTFVTTEGQ